MSRVHWLADWLFLDVSAKRKLLVRPGLLTTAGKTETGTGINLGAHLFTNPSLIL